MATRTVDLGQVVGPAGPNTVSTSTTTALNGVLTGNGSTVGAKSIDTSSLTNDNDHIPTSGVVKSALSTYAATGVNQNIIDNPTFLINQRGITTGIASGAYGPDRWIVYNSQSENVTIQNGAVFPVNGSVLQRLDAVTIAALTGRTVTASALIEQNGSLSLISGTVASFSASGANQYFTSQNLSILLTDSYTRSIQFFANSACTLKATKLELGDTQTLAHQENGAWVLNEIPDFETELLRCQTSTADSYDLYANQTVMTNQRVANPNLLDNWYFVGGGSQQGGGQFPINQRGLTSYSDNVYGIDRWKLHGTTRLDVANGYITITKKGSASLFQQTMPASFWASLAGRDVTYSFLTTTGFASRTITLPSDITASWDTAQATLGNLNVDLFGTPSTNSCGIRFYDATSPADTAYNLIAIKFELGDTQTLAHQENGVWVLNELPNYQQELAKCQRYYIPSAYGTLRRSVNGAGTLTFIAPVPVTMRSNPSVGSVLVEYQSIDYTANYSTFSYTARAGCIEVLASSGNAYTFSYNGVYGVTIGNVSADL